MNRVASGHVGLDVAAIRGACEAAMGRWGLGGRRILALVPDGTRSAPLDVVFPVVHEVAVACGASAVDVLVALGTHPPMDDDAIHRRLGITPGERETTYRRSRFMNHCWSNPGQLVRVGTLEPGDIESLSEGRMRERVDVTINKLVLDYDVLLVVGPTFPHEVVGFSGGNKYLFPGISGPEIIDAFHWLGALITNSAIIGVKHTPVRAIIDRAASMVPVERRCVSLVVDHRRVVGLFLGTPEEAWSDAADLSGRVHVRHKERAFESVLSCAPAMYGDLWVAGKCAYKLEPVVANGGEIIIYAPHITELSVTHGEVIRGIGYHVRDYFLKQSERFVGVPRGVMAHSTHVKGSGIYEEGREAPRIQVTLATGISEAECRAVNLGYRDVRHIDVAAWRDGLIPGGLYAPKAGETLYRLACPDDGARSRADPNARSSVPVDSGIFEPVSARGRS